MDDESIAQLVAQVRLLEADDVIVVGMLPRVVFSFWPSAMSDLMVITGERRLHLYDRHPETDPLLAHVILTMLDPDEIHRNKEDVDIAIFWRSLDGDPDHLLRAAIRVSGKEGFDSSVMSARRTRRKDFESAIRQGRQLWKRGA